MRAPTNGVSFAAFRCAAEVCVLHSFTSNAKDAKSSKGQKYVEYFVNGQWGETYNFFSSTGYGDMESETTTVIGDPTQVRGAGEV